MKCPGFEKFIDFLDGLLAEEEVREINLHLDLGCARCLQNRDWYQTVRDIVRRDPIFRPESWVRKQAVEIFERGRFRRHRVTGMMQAAHLTYDSMERLSIAGARTAAGSNRQLIYRAAGYNIDIQVAPSAKHGADIMGQVLRQEEAGFGSVGGLLIDLIRDDRELWSTTTGGFGEFAMCEIESGNYKLRVDTEDLIITIESLPVLE